MIKYFIRLLISGSTVRVPIGSRNKNFFDHKAYVGSNYLSSYR